MLQFRALCILLCASSIAYAVSTKSDATDSEETAESMNRANSYLSKEHTQATLSSRNQINGLEYLGIGYNAYKAKPYGDDIDHIDAGYQQPFVTFIWDEKREKEGVKQSSPEGVWLRHDATCHRDKQARKVNSMSDIAKMVEEEYSYSLNLYILTVNSKGGMSKVEKYMQETRKTLLAIRVQCSLYTTGMYMSHKWMLTKGAQTAVDKIHDFYKSKKCEKGLYWYRLSPECREYAQLWMDLINNFGTQVITRATYGKFLYPIVYSIGGKFLHIKSTEKSVNEEGQGEKSHISTSVFMLATRTRSREKQSTTEIKRSTENNLEMLYVVGGEIIPDDGSDKKYNAWKETIPNNPMPIKMQLTPLRHFLPHDLATQFVQAIEVYSRCATKENKYYCILPGVKSTKH